MAQFRKKPVVIEATQWAARRSVAVCRRLRRARAIRHAGRFLWARSERRGGEMRGLTNPSGIQVIRHIYPEPLPKNDPVTVAMREVIESRLAWLNPKDWEAVQQARAKEKT